MNSYRENNSRYINLETTYKRLCNLLEKRKGQQEYLNNTWRYVKKGNDQDARISQISKQIGSCTGQINEILSELTKCKTRHKAMNMAHGYVLEEIRRTEGIINKWKNTIRLVNNGQSVWIDSHGNKSTDNDHAYKYVSKKENELAKLRAWDKHISRYLA